MRRPKEISREEYKKRCKRLTNRAIKLASLDGTTGEFWSSSPFPCGVPSSRHRDQMFVLNRDNLRRYYIQHLIPKSCDTVTTLHCPETIAECLVEDNNTGICYYHKHPVGECWFKAYPQEEE